MVRRKQYDEEERRIEEEYQRNLAEIDEEYRKAAKQIELEFAAKKAEVKKQFCDKNAGQNSTSDPSSVTSPSISDSVCTTSQCIEVNIEQPTKPQTNSLTRKPLVAVAAAAAAATAHVSGEAELDRNNSDGNNKMARIGARQICVDRMQIVYRLAKQKGQVRVYDNNCGCCDATTMTGAIGDIFGVFDPGGSVAGLICRSLVKFVPHHNNQIIIVVTCSVDYQFHGREIVVVSSVKLATLKWAKTVHMYSNI